MRVLVTGATGFMGRALCGTLLRDGREVVAVVRRPGAAPDGCLERVVPDIASETDWTRILDGIQYVIHLATRMAARRDTAADPLAAFHRVNVLGTLSLAQAAAESGVKRFVFLSSVKVHGETTPREPFSESAGPAPAEPYALSKWRAELGLNELAASYNMAVVILRPPLVYGRGVKGNFHSLMRLCARGFPLPLRGIANRRSLLYLGNLINAVELCLSHPAAAGKTYLLRDGEDLSTSDLVRRLATALGRRVPLFPMPGPVLRLAGGSLGRSADIDRLLCSLAVDDSRIRQDLGWAPPFTVDQGLADAAAWYMAKYPSRGLFSSQLRPRNLAQNLDAGD